MTLPQRGTQKGMSSLQEPSLSAGRAGWTGGPCVAMGFCRS